MRGGAHATFNWIETTALSGKSYMKREVMHTCVLPALPQQWQPATSHTDQSTEQCCVRGKTCTITCAPLLFRLRPEKGVELQKGYTMGWRRMACLRGTLSVDERMSTHALGRTIDIRECHERICAGQHSPSR